MSSPPDGSDSTPPVGSDVPKRERLRGASRRFRAGIGPGSALLFVLFAAHGVATDFGVLDYAGVALAGCLFALSRLDRNGHWTPRVLLLLCVSAAMVVLAEVLLYATLGGLTPPPRLEGLYTSDADIGYRLGPSVSLVYRDAVVEQARYTTNSLGHRDGAPHGSGENRVLLLGDSMTFGELLDDEQTIDREIEKLSEGRFDAYSLAVPGYGAEASAITFSRSELRARATIFLFYPNDLRNDGLATQRNRVWKGFLVPGVDAAGHVFSDEQLDERLNRTFARSAAWLDIVRLRHLMKAIDAARRSPIVRGFEELPTRIPGPMGYRRENVEVVVRHTNKMREIARKRGHEFAVGILPSLTEATFERHYALVSTFVDELRRNHIEVLDDIDRYEASDYFAHNGHFDPSGATRTAEMIVDWLDRSVSNGVDENPK